MGLRGVTVVVCLVALAGCLDPPTPVLGFPGPEPIARWDTTFGAGLPLTIFYPATTERTLRPVVIFTAGWNQTRGSYLGYGEELAQWGYVAIIRAYPNPSLLGIGIDTSELQTQQITDLIDWCADENVRADSPLFGLADVTRVGTTGHSYGAAVSVDAALRDPRIGGRGGSGRDRCGETFPGRDNGNGTIDASIVADTLDRHGQRGDLLGAAGSKRACLVRYRQCADGRSSSFTGRRTSIFLSKGRD